MTFLKSTSLSIAHVFFLFTGLAWFYLSGKTSRRAHMALIYFFCLSAGRSNDWMSAWISAASRELALKKNVGVLGELSDENLNEIAASLRDKGYVVFENSLPPEMCERLMAFAMSTRANIRKMDHEEQRSELRQEYYVSTHPVAVRYDYPVDQLIGNQDVQDLLADASLLRLAGKYLRARPMADVLSMWWHTNYKAQPDSEAAQFYHFDMDRIKWLKIFIYLTDVGLADGPHSFIEGSHATGGIPRKFLKRGYARLDDADVLAYYGSERQITFKAPKGTIIVEDTRGLHKGNMVSENPRLILQLQFSNSLFGANQPKAAFTDIKSPILVDMLQQAPDLYRSFQ